MQVIIYKPLQLLFLIALFFIFSKTTLQAQNENELNQEEPNDSTKTSTETKKETFFEKVIDYIEFKNKADRINDTTRFRSKLVLSPVANYKPSTSWGFGIGSNWLFKFKNSTTDTRTSNVPLLAIYTLRKQIVIDCNYTVFTNHENWLMKGKISYSKFPQLYYGIGVNSLRKNEETIDFQRFLIEPLFLKQVADNLFVGGGFRYRNIWDVNYKAGGVLDKEKPLGYGGSVSAGLELAVTYDSRDNVLNALSGSLYEARYSFNGKKFGGTPFIFSKIDLRKYFKLSKRNDILAFQGYGFFSDEHTPVGELAAFGGDGLMRGYYRGRFLGNNMLAAQTEYRFPIYDPIGMVVFVGAGQVYKNRQEINLQNLRVGYGVGFRFKIVKSENLNVRIDVAKGDKLNFYFGIAEAF